MVTIQEVEEAALAAIEPPWGRPRVIITIDHETASEWIASAAVLGSHRGVWAKGATGDDALANLHTNLLKKAAQTATGQPPPQTKSQS